MTPRWGLTIWTMCLLPVLVAGEAAGEIEAITRPSGDVTLAFTQAGRIGEVLVKEGQGVEVGDPLVRLDDQAEQAQLAQLKVQAEDDTRVRAAKAQRDQKKIVYDRKKEVAARGGVTRLELEEAQLDVLIAELSLELAEFQHAQDVRKYKEASIRLDRMTITSPIKGIVESVKFEKGEAVDALEDVVRVVDISPLWIDVPAPLVQARRLEVGGKATVRFDRANGVEAEIVHKASVADAASDTLTVRVEAPNPSDRPAGEHVRVSFPHGD